MKKMKKVKSHSKTKTKVLSGKADKVDREVEMEKDNLFSKHCNAVGFVHGINRERCLSG